ncbi:hypothetical protein [Spirillospora sp. NPDC047279]|uniref:hypothetical protein n=1 Tax=Spirillospora sp. NPDC047279 TaxID=3155478 RepID=UPI0033DA99CC
MTALARFARTHAAWDEHDGLDDLLVTLADKVWKGRRVEALERKVVDRLAAVAAEPVWETFMKADDLLERIAAGEWRWWRWWRWWRCRRTTGPGSRGRANPAHWPSV